MNVSSNHLVGVCVCVENPIVIFLKVSPIDGHIFSEAFIDLKASHEHIEIHTRRILLEPHFDDRILVLFIFVSNEQLLHVFSRVNENGYDPVGKRSRILIVRFEDIHSAWHKQRALIWQVIPEVKFEFL
jgi:hypothetical protein